MRIVKLVLLAAALTSIGVACGGGSSNESTTTPPAATTTSASPAESPTGGGTTSSSTLVLKDNVFEPADFTVAAGSQITLMNEGAALHNFSVEGQDVDKDVQPGETETEDVIEGLAPGTYTMFCKYHRSIGMEGTLTITG
jgi:plastocyanin